MINHERDKKVHVFKFKKKTGYKKKQGHKQKYTTIKVISIGKKKAASKPKKELEENQSKTKEVKSKN